MIKPWLDDLFIGVCHEHRHAERETELGQIFANRAIADDAEGCSFKLTAHTCFWNMAGTVDGRRLGDVAPAIDHEADGHLGNRSDEARRSVGDQNSLGAGGFDVDVTNIDCDPQERDQIAHQREELCRARGLPVGDDDLAAMRGLRERLGVEHLACVVEPHVAELAQLGERSLPVIVLKHVGNVGEEYRAHRLLQVDNLSLLAEVGQWTARGKTRGV